MRIIGLLSGGVAGCAVAHLTGTLLSLGVIQDSAKTAEPELGWVTDATVVSVYDGDTCTVEVRKFIKVRLEDCWAPERREDGGVESGDYLAELIEGKRVRLRVGGSQDVWRKRTFGRDVGRIWVDGQDVSELMISGGHAFRTKAELRANQ